MLYDNYKEVQNNIIKACEKAGRNPDEVTLIAVSKTKPLSDIEELISYGVKEFGENKPQEMKQKIEEVSTPVNFHLIGHLQTNKVKYVVGKAVLIHSVDSMHLAEAIEKESAKKDIITDILIEVNMAEEETKFGLSAKDTESLVREISSLPHIRIKGLMTIAPFVDDPEENRPVFRAMKELLLDIKSKNIDNVDMNILSMGMTNDYMVAVEEGSTMVRVGTAIFGARNYNI
ncbi:MAG: YggS family pyridoxal phosphate-dependent enzyme [Eubacterium sp.]|nr:YggS family pyridoxal phosphate-dependent enzyme [Eubacterium sp.]